MKCSVFKDLLSVYQKGLTSEETNAEMKKHLEACDECRAVYEKVSEPVSQELPPGEKYHKFRKRPGANTFHKRGALIVSACLLMLAGLFIFAKGYKLPLSFDPEYMSAETYKAVMITQESGYTLVMDVNGYGDMLSDDSSSVRDAVMLVYHGIDNISGDVIDRTIDRDGQAVKVFYYCYKESLWDRVFSDPALRTGSEYWSVYGGDYQSKDLKPQMIEIYYLPDKKITRFQRLSDEAYDKLREHGLRVFSGMV